MSFNQFAYRLFFALNLVVWSPLVFSKGESPVFTVKESEQKIIDRYLNYHKQFFNQSCQPKVEPYFNQLFSRFQKTRYLIPVDTKNHLDSETVKYILPRLEQKIAWIEKQQSNLTGKSSFEAIYGLTKRLNQLLAEHLKYKRKYHLASNYSQRKKYRQDARVSREAISQHFKLLSLQIPFLLSFDFPVDHLKSRQEYDLLKSKNDEQSYHLANRVYMERKLLEDGAQEPNGSRNDLFLRSSFDTLYLSLGKKADFISENERYDLVFILQSIDFQLKSGKKRLLQRLAEWSTRTKNTLQFYSHLFDKVEKTQAGEEMLAGRLLKKKAQSTYDLKKYVTQKQSDAFLFWAKRPELYRALFAIETILFNEVGVQDPYKEERRDVAKLVINRHRIPFYSKLSLDDGLYYYLPHRYVKNGGAYSWLNTLFKEGEFSFTYFYIPGSLRIFCPDMSKRGKALRRDNLKIALGLLLKSHGPFDGLRYFSRESMIGRIDMGEVWSQFEAIGERPADRKRSRALWKKYKSGQFAYLYHFTSDEGRLYEVVQIDGTEWVIDPKRERIYGHRNPHQFTYFRLKK